jgi:hypothetical protein
MHAAVVHTHVSQRSSWGGGSLAMRLGRPKLVGLRYTMLPWRIPNHVAIGAHTPERHTAHDVCRAVAAFACLAVLPFPRTRAFAAATFLVVRGVQPKLVGLRYTKLPWRIPNHVAIGAHTPEWQARLDVGRAQFEFACLVVVHSGHAPCQLLTKVLLCESCYTFRYADRSP